MVAQGPLSPNAGKGGGLVYFEQLASLWEAGCEIYLWHYAYPEERASFESFIRKDSEVWGQLKGMCRSVTLSTVNAKPSLRARLENKIQNRLSGEYVENPVSRELAQSELSALIKRHNPDFIWAQHFGPAQVAVFQTRIPVIYSHHDWTYKIKSLKSGKAADMRLKTQEVNVCRKAKAVVSGSALECEEIRDAGCRNVFYLPLAYAPATLNMAESRAGNSPRVVHLGGVSTTATRLGLESFLKKVRPRLPSSMEIWVVGDMSGASPELEALLSGTVRTGYVPDLVRILRPYDIHVIPWEYATGQRTRLIAAFNFGQAVVAHRAAVAGFPELEDGMNCRLVDQIEDMPEAIHELYSDNSLRRRISEAARQTFEGGFTRESLLPEYRKILAGVSGREPA